jgi:subtilisin family serine protease
MKLQKEVIAMLIICIGLLASLSFVGSASNGIPDYVEGEIIVKYTEEVVNADGNEIIVEGEKSYEKIIYDGISRAVEIEKIVPNKELYTLRFEKGLEVEDLIEEYENLEEVEYAEPNYLLTSFVVPNDINYSLKWGLPNIDAERAWNLSIGNGSDVVIAIVDTGVDWDHPDLSGNIWNNTDEMCNESSDDDGNGYNGDCRGYDFTDINTTIYTDAGYTLDDGEDYNTTENNPMDYHGHGTHCSGISSAVGNNSLGVLGVCWNCSIMAVRAGFKIQHPTQGWVGSLETDDVVAAINYVTKNNATVVSMSFGGSHSTSLDAALNDSYDNGSILVAASGNAGTNSKQYPCGYDKVICVAATDSDNTSASYSNYGSWVDVAAPGTSVWSTYYDDRYISASGTSMAAPMVAGAIGLIKSLFDKNQTEIRDALNSTGFEVDFSGVPSPRLDVYSAILSFDETGPKVSLVSPSDNQVNLSVNQTFTCNMSDWQLKNVTFEIWNSSNDLYYNESKNISDIFNETNFNVTNLAYDNYNWNCKVFDNQSNSAYANSNFMLFLQNISVSLVSPSNSTNRNVNLTQFNCSAETEGSKGLVNMTFSLWNSTPSLIYNLTSNVSGTSNSSNFSYALLNEGSYLWNCKAFNNESEFDISDSNFTIIYDIRNPNVSLLDPDDASSYSSSSQTVDFGFNVSDDNDISNCSLIVNSELSLTNSSVDKSLTQNFSVDYAPGSYTWNINCSDDAGNVGNSSLQSFTVTAPSSGGGGSGGGGGGGGTTSSIPKIHDITRITEEGFSQGVSKSLAKDDKIKFTFFDSSESKHTLTVNEVNGSYVKITIQSNPMTFKLGINQSAKLNLSSPDYYDLFIKLNSIKDEEADITIQLINEEIPKPDSLLKVTGDAVDNKNELIEDGTEDLGYEVEKLKRITYVLVLIIIVVAILFLFIERKYIKKEIEENFLSHKEKFNKEVKPKN